MRDSKEQREHLLKRIALFKEELARTTNSQARAELAAKLATAEKTLKLLPFGSP